MRILVSVASKHGATFEIGEAIATELRGTGAEVDVQHPNDVGPLDGYDAFVLGNDGVIRWLGEPVARIAAGASPLWTAMPRSSPRTCPIAAAASTSCPTTSPTTTTMSGVVDAPSPCRKASYQSPPMRADSPAGV